MLTRYPGTTIEVVNIQKGSSRILFNGIFTTGGVTLSQVSVMTGLEPYVIQNWVKRGFLTSPVKRVYSKEQFARIIIINMLREALPIERICSLIKVIGGVLDDTSDDMISDDELYHRYVDMLAQGDDININDERAVYAMAERAVESFEERQPNTKRQLVKILVAMLYAHAASNFRKSSEDIIAGID